MSIYKTAVNHPVATALVFVAIAIFGLFSLSRLSINLFPEIETNSIIVMTTYDGASAQDIENNVTKPLENTLNSVSDLKHITSSSRENISVINLEFNYGIDIDVATNDVRDKLDMVTSLPDEASDPVIFKFGTDDIPIIILSVSAEESMPGLYKILDDMVSTPLARVNGVGQVSVSGLAQREVQVYCDPNKLEAYGISIETIASVIAAENRNIPAGNIDVGSNTYSVRVQKEFDDASEMLELVVGEFNGATVYLRDVASVDDTLQERVQETFTNGKLGGRIVIQKQSGANSVDIANKVRARLPEIQASLPSDIQLKIIIDTSDSINNTINSLIDTIMITFVIVMLVVFIFLGRWRATFIIVLTIPISLLAAFIYLLATGNTLNIISLSSLSIAIGMVVDDAIVVLENITTHIERGSRPRQAAIFATNEVSLSVIASTLTMLAVFLPLTMITGMAGILFSQLGWIVSIVMIVSTTAALTFTPMLCSKLLRKDVAHSKAYKLFFSPINKGLEILSDGYARMLNWSVRHRTVVILIACAAFFGTIITLFPVVKTEFFPTQDNGRISINVELPIGTRQEITRDVALRISDEFLEKYPEIKFINLTEGQADTDDIFGSLQDNGTHIISYSISLVSVTERERRLSLICDLMREDLKKYTEIRTFEVIESGSQGGVGGQAGVEIDIYGYDLTATDRLAAEISEKLLAVEGCTQVTISRDEYTPEYEIDLDREKLALNGLNVATTATYIRNRINGSVASYYREDGEEYDIRVRLDPRFRRSVEDLENITVYNDRGEVLKVRDLGRVIETQIPPTIERKDRERVITVTGSLGHGVALSDVIDEARQIIPQTEFPSGISAQIGGSYEDQQDTFANLGTLLVLIIILVFIVMAAQFESLTYPFVIMFSVPFAFTGVLLGLVVTGTPLGVMALIGVIMLIGIVVKNGIVLIDYTILCRERGMSIISAVVTAGKSRLRPILMTTLTTVLGMVPLAIGTGEGSEMWRSMGMTVVWGLSISTLITLVLIPVLYCVFAGTGMKRQRRKNGSLEPATPLKA
ncbi:MAG: efflux RND transporter permease subunit [Rikenellaceae bacterium]|nr:efflux RND transporter permease subunit [Rikenellaceae bacterium]